MADSQPTIESPKPQDVPTPNSSWQHIKRQATAISQITALFLALLIAGGVIGYFLSNSRTSQKTNTPSVTSLSKEDLAKLAQLGSDLGTSGQTLNIAADALFRGKVAIGSDLNITGSLNANGPVTLSSLNVTGSSAQTGLNVGSNLFVGGNGSFQQNLTVGGLTTLANLSVNGSASLNSLNTNNLSVRNISISGPLTIAHIATQGATPSIAAGSVGGGGTVSISGNDTAGTININTGSGPGTLLASVTFRAAYSSTAHVQLTPLTAAAATCGYYVTRTSAGFQIRAATPPASAALSFDFLVVQ